jgi:hypothetical protein
MVEPDVHREATFFFADAGSQMREPRPSTSSANPGIAHDAPASRVRRACPPGWFLPRPCLRNADRAQNFQTARGSGYPALW